MDKNTLAAVLGSVSLAGLVTYGCVTAYMGIDGTITATVAASLGAIAGAVATYLKTAGSE